MGLSSPSYAQMFATPTMDQILVSSTANTAFVGPGATGQVSLSTGATGGKQINDIVFIGTGTTIAGSLNLWRLNGSTYILYDSIVVPVMNASFSTTANMSSTAASGISTLTVTTTTGFPSSGTIYQVTSTGIATYNMTAIASSTTLTVTFVSQTVPSGNVTTGATTYVAAPWRYVKTYNNLILPSSSDSLTITSTVANQLVAVTADGATP